MPLPAELAFLWNGAASGERKLNLASILEGVPRFHQLPSKAADNNHRGDGKGNNDRLLKSYQQTLLHILRLLGASYLGDQDTNMCFKQA